MEMKCLNAWSVAAIQQGINENSDQHDFWVCDNCNILAYRIQDGIVKCTNCDGNAFTKISMPWACKTLFQELQGMGIQPYLFATEDQIKREKSRKKDLFERAKKYINDQNKNDNFI